MDQEQGDNQDVALTQEEKDQAAFEEAAFEAGFAGQDLPANPTDDKSGSDKAEDNNQGGDGSQTGEQSSGADGGAGGETSANLEQLSNEELRAMLAQQSSQIAGLQEELTKSTRDLYGRFGDINGKLQEFQRKAPAEKADAAPRFTAEKFTRLAEDFPDIAEALAADLSATMEPGESQSSFDERVNTAVAAARIQIKAEIAQETALERMNELRPDWMQVRATPEFTQFKNQLSPADQAKYDNTWKPTELNGFFTRFDAWKADKAKTQQGKDKNTKRLEDNIRPRGTPTDNVPSENDAFEAGFKSARGGT